MFDIILLQEVNVFFARYLKCKLAGLYKFSAGRNFEDDHFYEGTFTLIRTATVSLVGSNIVYFERTGIFSGTNCSAYYINHLVREITSRKLHCCGRRLKN